MQALQPQLLAADSGNQKESKLSKNTIKEGEVSPFQVELGQSEEVMKNLVQGETSEILNPLPGKKTQGKNINPMNVLAANVKQLTAEQKESLKQMGEVAKADVQGKAITINEQNVAGLPSNLQRVLGEKVEGQITPQMNKQNQPENINQNLVQRSPATQETQVNQNVKQPTMIQNAQHFDKVQSVEGLANGEVGSLKRHYNLDQLNAKHATPTALETKNMSKSEREIAQLNNRKSIFPSKKDIMARFKNVNQTKAMQAEQNAMNAKNTQGMEQAQALQGEVATNEQLQIKKPSIFDLSKYRKNMDSGDNKFIQANPEATLSKVTAKQNPNEGVDIFNQQADKYLGPQIRENNVVAPNIITAGAEVSFDQAVKSTDGNAIIKEIGDYIAQNRFQAQKSIELNVAHKDLGQMNLKVIQAENFNPQNQALDIQITTATKMGHEFFRENQGQLLGHLTTAGVNVNDIKLEQSNTNSDLTKGGQQDQETAQNQQNNRNNHKNGNERRKEMWELLKERTNA